MLVERVTAKHFFNEVASRRELLRHSAALGSSALLHTCIYKNDVVFSLFSICITLYLNVTSTVLRKNRNTDFLCTNHTYKTALAVVRTVALS